MTRNKRLALFWVIVILLAGTALFFAPLLNRYHSFGESTILMWEYFGLIGGTLIGCALVAVFFVWFWEWAHKAR